MKNILTTFIYINIFVISIYSQQPNFFPLNIGNEYQMYDGYDYQFCRIEGDSIYPNGNTYFSLPYSVFEFGNTRIDSNGNIFSISKPFFIGIISSPEEYMLFKADAELDEIWPVAWDFNPVIDTGYAKCIYVDSVYLFGKNRLVKGVLIFDASYYYYYFWLAEGIGLVREQYDDGSISLLNYAKIDDTIYGTLVSVENEVPTIPEEFNVSQNYPNPFNGITNIDMTIPNKYSNEKIKLSVFNILGSKVYENSYSVTRYLTISLNTDHLNLSSGTYFYSVSYDRKIIIKKFLLLK